MRPTNVTRLLIIVATLLFAPGVPCKADFSGASGARNWLDEAVREKRCPLTPINVSREDWSFRPDSLLKRITIRGGTLYVDGLDRANHIVVGRAEDDQYVHIDWNGRRLGRFGPISRIVIWGHAGNDVLIVKSDVSLPAVLSGGRGDDCIQGGSGADRLLGGPGNDVLIAGTGRPALEPGPGANRIVVPQGMGTLRYAPGVSSNVLSLLQDFYNLETLSSSSAGASSEPPTPILLGASDLANPGLLAQLHQVRAAGQAVVLTDATADQYEQLRLTLNHPNAASMGTPNSGGTPANVTIPVTFFRTSQRQNSSASDFSTGYFGSLVGPLSVQELAYLSQVFAATAIPPPIPKDSPTNDLTRLANAYTFIGNNENSFHSGLQTTNTVYAVRSFLNQADFYYVYQITDYWASATQLSNPPVNLPDWQNDITNVPSDFGTPSLYTTSPNSTQCSMQTTSGVNWSIGGSAGWNQQQGFNALLNGGVGVSTSYTVTCPPTTISNSSNPGTGVTDWQTLLLDPNLSVSNSISFKNQWIWEVPFKNYQQGQQNIDFGSSGVEEFLLGCNGDCLVLTDLQSKVPLPFGDTFALLMPVVSSVSPTCANAGTDFTINGSGLYPSLVSGVVIDGTPLPSTQYKTASDTQINVVAPQQSGFYLPVVVQTAEGISNSNVTIEISTFGLCPSVINAH
jgi:hypothetical protein